jgi:hypothetical protein
MAYNTILIKRRIPLPGALAGPPASLSGGELAFNEVNSVLYYGASAGVIPIAGAGMFVDLTSDQTIGGNKTFTGLTTLSSTTFSPNSVIDAGANKITNVADPVNNQDAVTKKYAYDWFVEKVESEAVTLQGGLTVSNGFTTDTATVTGDATIEGNLTVNGDFTVLGNVTTIETETTTTSAFTVTNNGSTTALTVTQVDGVHNVAEFKDGSDMAMVIAGTGTGGQVAIGTDTPASGIRLTVNGSISASDTIYGGNGLEIGSNAGTATLWVESGKVGVNTENPNEALTIVGNVSATGNYYGLDIYARNADLTGTLDVDGATTLNNTLDVTSAVDFDSTLNVDSYATFNDTVTVTNNLSANSDVVGTQYVSRLVDFIIDGGDF